MADIKTHIKAAAWTEAEVVALAAGGILATKILSDEKIHKDAFALHPEWFTGRRHTAPFVIKWSGAIKAGGACMASTYVDNKWLKMLLIGVAIQGTVQQIRQMTFDEKKMSYRFQQIGAGESELDAQLKALAEKNRVNGPEYIDDKKFVNGMEPLGDRYQSSVGQMEEPLGDRYQSSVGHNKVYDEDIFNLHSSDATTAF